MLLVSISRDGDYRFVAGHLSGGDQPIPSHSIPAMRGMLSRLCQGAGRMAIAVLLLLVGLLTPAHAIGPLPTGRDHGERLPPTVEPAPLAMLVYLAAYRAQGPPDGNVSHYTDTTNPGIRADQERVTWVFVVGVRGGGRSAMGTWYAYAGGDPVQNWDPSGLAYYLFDGTWNHKDLNTGTHIEFFEANVRPTYADEAIEYIGGPGNAIDNGKLMRLLGGMGGAGGTAIVDEMVGRFISNWDRGDHDVKISGFSRGAALAVEFANRLADLKREDPGKYQDLDIDFLGLFDTVHSFGLAGNRVNLTTRDSLPTDIDIQVFRHAVAAHESRTKFPVTWQEHTANIKDFSQEIFGGNHCDIGGGYAMTGLSDITLKWMGDAMVAAGGQLAQGWDANLSPNAKQAPHRTPVWYCGDLPRKFPRGMVQSAIDRGVVMPQWNRRFTVDWRREFMNGGANVVESYHHGAPYLIEDANGNTTTVDPMGQYRERSPDLFRQYFDASGRQLQNGPIRVPIPGRHKSRSWAINIPMTTWDAWGVGQELAP